MSADVLDFDMGLRALRSPSKVNAVMARRRFNERMSSSNSNGGPPPVGGSPVIMRQAMAA